MNIPTSLSPTKALAFADTLTDPEERQALLENFVQRPWSNDDRVKAVLVTLGFGLEQLQSPKPQTISSGLDHLVVGDTFPAKQLQNVQSQKPEASQKPPPKKRYYRYPPNKNYTLDEVFDDPDSKAPTLPPLLALQASLNAAKTKPAPLPKADLEKTDPTPNAGKKGSSRLSDHKIRIPATQSPIVKSKKHGVIPTPKRDSKSLSL
jgi:hypothetical protein